MKIEFTKKASEDYSLLRKSNFSTYKKINSLLQDILLNGPDKGIGKPEKLKDRSEWSRRIDKKNRLVYELKNNILYIESCLGHYEDK
jgi:toxin YoeB